MAERKFSLEIARRICDAKRAGDSDPVAASKGGISRKTLWQWLKRGERGDLEYTAFLSSFLAAENEGRVRRCAELANLRGSAPFAPVTAA